MKRKSERLLALLLAVTLLTGLLPIGTGVKSRAAEQITLRNPRILKTAQEVAPGFEGQKELKNPTTENGITTWDCIWFGNYWQEDTNGDGKADKKDKKTPIKWRVLSVNGDDAFLLADKNLDCQRYNDTDTSVTWETCTMRSWLNGYGAGANKDSKDYSGSGFINYAFSAREQSAIQTTNVVNNDNLVYDTKGGNDTLDKVYLLSIDEVTNPAYGFTYSGGGMVDTRCSVNTAYTAAGGEIGSDYMVRAGGTANWWIRSPGRNSRYASFMRLDGSVNDDGSSVDSGIAVRLALHLNLSSDSSWSYAGTVPSDDVAEWDCIWFGNYWQEDTNGDGKADKNDAKTPIKWRVLSVNGDDAFLLADKNLDCQRYNDTYTNVTWETCTMRSWLNGYGGGANIEGKDYSGSGFINHAFSAGEQSAIRTTNVVNNDNLEYDIEGGNDTSDKVYLLSIDEVKNSAYGFTSSDEITATRSSVNTAYTAAGGEIGAGYTSYAGNVDIWRLRSPGRYSDSASFVNSNGYVNSVGSSVSIDYGLTDRPALHLNLSSALGCSYAGTVSSDGTVTAPETPHPDPTTPPTNQPGSSGGTATETPRPDPTTPPTNQPGSSGETATATPHPNPTATPTNQPGSSGGTATATPRPDPTITPTNQPGSTEETATARPNTSVSPGASPGTNQVEAEERIPQSIYAKSLTKTYGSRPFILPAFADSDGKLTYTSSSPKVATISPGGQVSVKGYGKTVITIHAEAVDEYMQAEKKITLTVVPKQVMIKKANSPSRRKIYFSWTTDKSVAGYQIQLSSRKNFKMETVQRIYGKKKKSILITGIKSRKTYYVRIRAYQKMGKERYYGAWSKSRAVKIK